MVSSRAPDGAPAGLRRPVATLANVQLGKKKPLLRSHHKEKHLEKQEKNSLFLPSTLEFPLVLGAEISTLSSLFSLAKEQMRSFFFSPSIENFSFLCGCNFWGRRETIFNSLSVCVCVCERARARVRACRRRIRRAKNASSSPNQLFLRERERKCWN